MATARPGRAGILNVRRPEAIREVTHFLTGGRVTHNAWLRKDGRYLFTTDERKGRPVEGWVILLVVSDIQGGLFVVGYTGP